MIAKKFRNRSALHRGAASLFALGSLVCAALGENPTAASPPVDDAQRLSAKLQAVLREQEETRQAHAAALAKLGAELEAAIQAKHANNSAIAELGKLEASLQEKETKIATLQTAVEKLQAQVAAYEAASRTTEAAASSGAERLTAAELPRKSSAAKANNQSAPPPVAAEKSVIEYEKYEKEAEKLRQENEQLRAALAEAQAASKAPVERAAPPAQDTNRETISRLQAQVVEYRRILAERDASIASLAGRVRELESKQPASVIAAQKKSKQEIFIQNLEPTPPEPPQITLPKPPTNPPSRKIASSATPISAPSSEKAKGGTVSVELSPLSPSQPSATKLPVIFFSSSNSELEASYKATLEELKRVIESSPNAKITLIGHSAKESSESVELKTSENRAKSLANYLTARGIPSSNLKIVPAGSQIPLDPENPKKNRRVEIEIML